MANVKTLRPEMRVVTLVPVQYEYSKNEDDEGPKTVLAVGDTAIFGSLPDGWPDFEVNYAICWPACDYPEGPYDADADALQHIRPWDVRLQSALQELGGGFTTHAKLPDGRLVEISKTPVPLPWYRHALDEIIATVTKPTKD